MSLGFGEIPHLDVQMLVYQHIDVFIVMKMCGLAEKSVNESGCIQRAGRVAH